MTAETGPTIAVTRMRFRRFWLLLPALVMFRRLYADGRLATRFATAVASRLVTRSLAQCRIGQGLGVLVVGWSLRTMHATDDFARALLGLMTHQDQWQMVAGLVLAMVGGYWVISALSCSCERRPPAATGRRRHR